MNRQAHISRSGKQLLWTFAVSVLAWWAMPNGGRLYAQFATVINSPPTVIDDGESITSDTQLNVYDGGTVGSHVTAGTLFGQSSNIEVNISGGTVGSFFSANAGCVANITGGMIGARFFANGSNGVHISGGEIGSQFNVSAGTTVDITGGTIGDQFVVRSGSMVDVSGGILGDNLAVSGGSFVGISGGTLGDGTNVASGSQLHLFGAAFRLDGNPISGLDTLGDTQIFDIPAGGLLSGTLADGTPFAFHTSDNDSLATGAVTLHRTALPPIGPGEIVVPVDVAPLGIREGQTIILHSGGTIGRNFSAGRGSTVNIDGGEVGLNFEAVGADVTVSGGIIGQGFDAFDGSAIHFSGGTISSDFDAHSGSVVNITGGSITRSFQAWAGSVVNLSGGTMGDGHRFEAGSDVHIFGGEFRLDGVLIGGLETIGDSVSFAPNKGWQLTGTLEDGTPFELAGQDFNTRPQGTITLHATALPQVGPPSITVPNDPVPLGIRGGQTLHLMEGGAISDNFNAGLGSTVIIDGGQIGSNFEAVGSNVTVTSGKVGPGFNAFQNSAVNILGGTIGANAVAGSGSVVNVSGGVIGERFIAAEGSEINISGGTFGDALTALPESHLNIAGGEFRLDGQLISGLNSEGDSIALDLPAESMLSCTLADGTPFAYSVQDDGAFLWSGTLRLVSAAVPPTGPVVIRVPSESAPAGIREGQTLLLDSGGAVGAYFRAGWGSSVIISGGEVGENFEAAGARVEVSGGEVGPEFDVFYGTIVEITGGNVAGNFYARNGSVVNLSGGNIEGGAVDTGGEINVSGGQISGFFRADPGSRVNISGGVVNEIAVNENAIVNVAAGIVDHTITAHEGSLSNLSGGIVDQIQAYSGSTIAMFGTSFILNGTDITSTLNPNVPFLVTERGGALLSGNFADGTPFEFELSSGISSTDEFFALESVLTITRVSVLPGDFNRNGEVDGADYVVWRSNLNTSVATRGSGADGNFDGEVTYADYEIWKLHFGETGSGGNGAARATDPETVAPEPSATTSLLIATLIVSTFGCGRSRPPWGST